MKKKQRERESKKEREREGKKNLRTDGAEGVITEESIPVQLELLYLDSASGARNKRDKGVQIYPCVQFHV